ncbi:MAG: CBS domain-containing protein, partial [Sediminibacterium sp.]|nr:CBS domain-containing protein [Sediminibacterium sp.]
TNDSYITQLNTYTEAGTGLVIVTIKINKIEVSDIVATFQRYDYVVRYYFGEEEYANELKENYQHLVSYLNM